jgi:hypothetical protein
MFATWIGQRQSVPPVIPSTVCHPRQKKMLPRQSNIVISKLVERLESTPKEAIIAIIRKHHGRLIIFAECTPFWAGKAGALIYRYPKIETHPLLICQVRSLNHLSISPFQIQL